MNNKEYIAELAQQSGYTQTDTQKMVAAVIEQMGNSFEEGNSVLIPNFGTFEVKKRLERIIVNPGTQQRMLVPPKLVLNFRPKESVKDKLNKA
ncbi:HU family DNA-binding protein [Hallella sp.]|uniref:HU family DNA-binding protein n=1 Tax=Hallella TaxID=52228 RepID=UPI002584ABBE|nr:HU family DNA-binding protein [Hallella sp.]MBS7398703.1 HU family DNA-binding protein [Prevotella sp.]MCI7434245.1 HU family DNA-binding protein [Prevotella sp.]MDD7145874.1 HU family DNA-binding protein [Hallella sp.]MDR4000804.1 HU family DNA-binding protein [Hallella sp.]MDY5033285.1 HU family DNA-binding protein [Prevotella sp.]